jgi:hypothetical protein
MKSTLFKGMACAGMLLISFSARQASAQNRDDDTFYHTREGFYAAESWKMHLFDRVRADLDYVQKTAFAGADEYRIVRTKDQVTELQGKMAEGRFDQPELDDVIAGLGRVVADNRLNERDRNMLNDDLNRVRDYRAHHEEWH